MCTISFSLHYPQGTKLKSNLGNLTALFEDKNMFKRPVNTCLNIYHYMYMIFVVQGWEDVIKLSADFVAEFGSLVDHLESNIEKWQDVSIYF